MDKITKKIEMVANVAIILAASAILVVLVRSYFLERKIPDSPEIAIGTTISIPNVDISKKHQTLILALKKGCKYCTESATFYQRLFKEIEERGKTQLVIVSPNEQQDAKSYLAGLGLNPSLIVQVSLNSIQVKGTPTLLLVDNKGNLTSQWVGKLSPNSEAEVLAKM